MRKDSEILIGCLFRHQLPVVLKKHFGRVTSLKGDLSCRLGDGKAVGAKGVTEAIMDKGYQPVSLRIDELIRSGLKQSLKAKFVRDIRQYGASFFGVGCEPFFQGWKDRCQSTGGSLGLVLTHFDYPFSNQMFSQFSRRISIVRNPANAPKATNGTNLGSIFVRRVLS